MARGQAAMLKAQFGSQQGSQSDAHKDELYWALASVAEALIALGDPQGPEALEEAKRHARAQWMVDTTVNQIERVKKLRA